MTSLSAIPRKSWPQEADDVVSEAFGRMHLSRDERAALVAAVLGVAAANGYYARHDLHTVAWHLCQVASTSPRRASG